MRRLLRGWTRVWEGRQDPDQQNLTDLEKDSEFYFGGKPLKTLKPGTINLCFEEMFMGAIRTKDKKDKGVEEGRPVRADCQ